MRPLTSLLLTVGLGALSFGVGLSGGALAQDEGSAAAEPTAAPAQVPASAEDEEPRPEEEPAVRKQFTRAEVKRICNKYQGQLIAFYGEVFKVEDCERRPIMSNKTVYELQRSGKKIVDVDGDTVAALPEGEPLDLAMTIASARGCRQLEGRYVTFSSVDVYYVEKCKKRIFPDWETYVKHREKRGDKKGEVLSLSWVEFAELDSGEPIGSVIDDIFAKLLTGDAGVDIIPADEACEGVDGRVVSYYSRLYRVERCRKREIVEPEVYLKKAGPAKLKIKELTSQQWLSLPDGQPIDEKPTKQKRG